MLDRGRWGGGFLVFISRPWWATGYLALMSLMGMGLAVARPGALWMNCVVASIAFWRFRWAGLFDVKLFLSVAITSVPAAWWGSRMHLDDRIYELVLGMALAAAGWFVGWGRAAEIPSRKVFLPFALLGGGMLGLLAGMTGIGGGVFLTPFIIFMGWSSPRSAGGVSALFIVVNSLSGLIGLGEKALQWQTFYTVLLLAGIAGALAGTHFSVNCWNTTTFRRVLAAVLWIASIKLLAK